jgi:hypothetical protein
MKQRVLVETAPFHAFHYKKKKAKREEQTVPF